MAYDTNRYTGPVKLFLTYRAYKLTAYSEHNHRVFLNLVLYSMAEYMVVLI